MLLSFIPLGLQVLTAIWQCQAVTTDATGSKGHFFIPPYQAGIDFSLIIEEHKKRRGFQSSMPNATQKCSREESNMEVRCQSENKEKWNLKPSLFTLNFKI